MWPFRNSKPDADIELDVPHRVRYQEICDESLYDGIGVSYDIGLSGSNRDYAAPCVSSYVAFTPLTADAEAEIGSEIEQRWRDVARTMLRKSAYTGHLSC